MRPYTTVLFDLDGTLIDSIRLILDSYHHTLAVHGHPPRGDDDWLRGIGTPLAVQLGEWAAEPRARDAMIATYRAYNLAHHDARVRPYAGVTEMVGALRARGTKLGLVTSKNRSGAERGLRVAGLTEAIATIVGADDVTHPKPHREPVDRALALLGARPETTLFVGDSIHDMESGRAAGVATAAALWGPFSRATLAPSEPDHWMEKPLDLLSLFPQAAP